MKSSENSFQTTKGCLLCSIRLGNHFSPKLKPKFFFEKNSDFFFRKMSLGDKNCRRGTFGVYYHTFCCKISRNVKEDPLMQSKYFRKNLIVPTKRIQVRNIKKRQRGSLVYVFENLGVGFGLVEVLTYPVRFEYAHFKLNK